MVFFSRTIEHCNRALHSLSVDKLDSEYLNKVKYACIKVDHEYYHNYLISEVKDLRDLSLFGDITIYSTYLKKEYNSTLGENHQNLYNLFHTLDEKCNVAIALKDLVGLKYLKVNPVGLILEHFSNQNRQIIYSIELDDIDTFEIIFTKHIDNTELQNLNFYLQLAYKHESLDIATYLIRQGANFNSKHLLLSWFKKPFIKYLDHIDFLLFTEKINQRTYIHTEALLQSVYCKYTQTNNNSSELTSLIHTNSIELDILSIHYNIITKSLFSLTIASNFPHFVIPAMGYLNPFFKPENTFYKIYIAKTANPHFKYQFIHELTHAFLYLIFNNKGNPYFMEEEKEYKEAKNAFLKKFYEAVGYKYDSLEEKQKPLENILSENPRLNIHEYCITDNSNKKSDLFINIYDNILLKNWEINEIINIDITELEQITSNQVRLLLDIEKTVKKDDIVKFDANKFLNLISQYFNKDNSFQIVKEYRKIQKELEGKIHDVCEFNILKNVNSRLASRIYEYSKRNEPEWDNELLPRLAEFYVNKEELTDDLKELLSPLYQYWSTYIIPHVTSILDNEKFSLPVLCDELSFFPKLFSHCLQDSTLQDALL